MISYHMILISRKTVPSIPKRLALIIEAAEIAKFNHKIGLMFPGGLDKSSEIVTTFRD